MPYNQVFTEADIPEIFRLRLEGVSLSEIAEHYGVFPSSIRRILNREAYKRVPVPEEMIRAVQELRYTRGTATLVGG